MTPKLKEVVSITWFCIAILCISFLSLWSSYHWFTSSAWTAEFSYRGHGEIIELVRTLLLSLGASYFIGIVWRKEVAEFLQSNRVLAKRWRRLFLVIGICIFIFSLYYHLWIGPSTLQEKYPANSDSFRSYFLPYLVYFPYTLVNYNILALVWVTASSYGAFNDLNKSLSRTNQLGENLSSIEAIYETSTFNTNHSVEEIVEREFSKFSTNFVTLISRYTILFLSISVILLFEILWGASTLTDQGQSLMVLTYGFSILALVISLWLFYHYHVAFWKSSICLLNLHCNYEAFESKHNLSQLLRRILNSHFNLYVFFSFTFVIIFFYLVILIAR